MTDFLIGVVGLIVFPLFTAVIAFIGNLVFLNKSFKDNVKDVKGLLTFIYLVLILAICVSTLNKVFKY